MQYKGFDILHVEWKQANGKNVDSRGVFLNGKRLALTADGILAKRMIDEKLKKGIWKVDDNE